MDIVGNIRPLDTLKVAESLHAKVVKSRDVRTLTGWFNQRMRELVLSSSGGRRTLPS